MFSFKLLKVRIGNNHERNENNMEGFQSSGLYVPDVTASDGPDVSPLLQGVEQAFSSVALWPSGPYQSCPGGR